MYVFHKRHLTACWKQWSRAAASLAQLGEEERRALEIASREWRRVSSSRGVEYVARADARAACSGTRAEQLPIAKRASCDAVVGGGG